MIDQPNHFQNGHLDHASDGTHMDQCLAQSTIPLGFFLSGTPPQTPQRNSGLDQTMVWYGPNLYRGAKCDKFSVVEIEKKSETTFGAP